jgi:hypothetical protein
MDLLSRFFIIRILCLKNNLFFKYMVCIINLFYNTSQILMIYIYIPWYNIYYPWFILREWISLSTLTWKAKAAIWDVMRRMNFSEHSHIEGKACDLRCEMWWGEWISLSTLTWKAKPAIWDVMRRKDFSEHSHMEGKARDLRCDEKSILSRTNSIYTPAPQRRRGVYCFTSVRPRYFSSHFSQ